VTVTSTIFAELGGAIQVIVVSEITCIDEHVSVSNITTAPGWKLAPEIDTSNSPLVPP
jgi:hypothetical protein